MPCKISVHHSEYLQRYTASKNYLFGKYEISCGIDFELKYFGDIPKDYFIEKDMQSLQ